MLKIQTNQKALEVLNRLHNTIRKDIEEHARRIYATQRPEPYTATMFVQDAIVEIAYKEENGDDGNWQEFTQFHSPYMTDVHYAEILKQMIASGWNKELEKF